MAKLATKSVEITLESETAQTAAPAIRAAHVGDRTSAGISPVAGLHSSIEKAYRAEDFARSEIERGPFIIGMAGVFGTAALFWFAIAKLVSLF